MHSLIHSARRTATLAALTAASILPVTVRAQGAVTAGAWRIEPSVGVWRHDDNFGGSGLSQPHHAGPAVALTLSRQRGAVWRITASATYHRLDDAVQVVQPTPSGQPRTDVYDTEIVSVSAGMAADVWRAGATSLGFGAEVGAGWKRYPLDRSSGPSTSPFLPTTFGSNWSPVGVLAPSVVLRRTVAARVELTATARALLAIGDMQPNAVPMIALGTAYRF